MATTEVLVVGCVHQYTDEEAGMNKDNITRLAAFGMAMTKTENLQRARTERGRRAGNRELLLRLLCFA